MAGYLSYQIDPKSSFNARVDYANVEANVLPNDLELIRFTGTLAHNMWENVLTRLEVRWDHSLKSDFDSLVGDNSGDAVTVALNAVYQFWRVWTLTEHFADEGECDELHKYYV